METVTAFAPASIGNFIVGFDILGMAVNSIGDQVTVAHKNTPVATEEAIQFESVSGVVTDLPKDPQKNTATAAMIAFLKDHPIKGQFLVSIEKGIPLSSGLGGSAASAVAGVFAINQFLDKPLQKKELLKYAVAGEAIASGSAHADNVAPSLLGGLQIVTDPVNFQTEEIPFSKALYMVLVNPSMKVDTKKARGVLQDSLPLKTHVEQMSALSGFICACYTENHQLLQSSLFDNLIEPQRASMIPGFQSAKQAAINAGALAFSISGAGPTVFAVAKSKKVAKEVSLAIEKSFQQMQLKSTSWVSQVNHEGAVLG